MQGVNEDEKTGPGVFCRIRVIQVDTCPVLAASFGTSGSYQVCFVKRFGWANGYLFIYLFILVTPGTYLSVVLIAILPAFKDFIFIIVEDRCLCLSLCLSPGY